MSRKQYLGLLVVCGLLALAGSVVVGLFLDSSTAVLAAGDAIRTSKLELVDSMGTVRGMYHVDPEKGPELVIKGDEQSKVVVGVDILGSPEMTFVNKAGDPQMVFGLDDFGAEIVVFSPNNERMVEIYVDETAFGVIEVLNAAGKSKQMIGR
jgi:hypothetical protein